MMRMSIAILSLGLLGAPLQQPALERWEYLVQFSEGSGLKLERQQAQLDSLGAQGWELVSTLPLAMGGNTGGAVFYLKRRAS